MSKPLHLDPSRDRYILADAVEITSSHLYALPDGPLPKLLSIGDIEVAGQPLSIPEYRLKGIRQVHTVTLLEMISNREIRARSLLSQIDPVSLGGEIGVYDLLDYFLTRKQFLKFCKRLAIEVADTSTPDAAPPEERVQPAEPAAEPEMLKRSALIARFDRQWKTISADLSDAKRNGLKEEAATKRHGYWYVDKAVAWAKVRGKINQSPEQPSRTSAFDN